MSKQPFLLRAETAAQSAGLSLNPAVPIQSTGCPTITCVVDTDGIPLAALLLEPMPDATIEAIARSIPIVRCLTDEEQQAFLANPSAAVSAPHRAQSTPARWELAFGEARTRLHWSKDSRCVVAYKTLLRRLQSGWNAERALTTPAAEAPQKNAKRVLYRHANGQWAKRILGKIYYFGSGDFEAAYANYLQQRDAILSGNPEDRHQNPHLRQIANRFLDVKQQAVNTGALNHRTFLDYRSALEKMIICLGSRKAASELNPTTFQHLKEFLQRGVSNRTAGNFIRRILVFVNWVNAHDLTKTPIRTGPDFRPPSRLVQRREDANKERQHGLRMFEPQEIHALLAAAPVTFRAMILLGLNCGMGNTDCSSLNRSAIDFRSHWLDYPRPKTLIPRKVKLWPETIAAIRAAIESRPTAADPDDEGAVFLTKTGRRYVRIQPLNDGIAKEFTKLLEKTGLKRHGLNFYALRHTFQTFADEHGDDTATRLVMGHADNSMSNVYRQRFPEQRLIDLSDFVRSRVLPPEHATGSATNTQQPEKS